MDHKPFSKSKEYYTCLKCQANTHISEICIEPTMVLQITAFVGCASILLGNKVMCKISLVKKQSKQLKKLGYYAIFLKQ